MNTRHPVVAWMAIEGVSARALARDAGYNENYVRLMLTGRRRASQPFQSFCAVRYRMPVDVLFSKEVGLDKR